MLDTVKRETDHMTKIGQHIRQRREAKGLTVAEVATLVGVSPAQVYNWEADRFVPSLTSIMALRRNDLLDMDAIDGGAA